MIEAVRSACAADLTDLDYLQCLARDGLIEARGGQRLLAEQPATDWIINYLSCLDENFLSRN